MRGPYGTGFAQTRRRQARGWQSWGSQQGFAAGAATKEDGSMREGPGSWIGLALCFVLASSLTSSIASGQSATYLASVSITGAEANGSSVFAALSGNGESVAFATAASNLIPADDNGKMEDIVVRDLDAGSTILVSRSTAGQQGNGRSTFPSISENGARLAFVSQATNLAAADLNLSLSDVFLHDRSTGETVLASVSSSGEQGNGASTQPCISGDGRFIVFLSESTNLLAGRADANGSVADVFLRDTFLGVTTIASVDAMGSQAPLPASHAVVSRDGSLVAFATGAALVPDDRNGLSDVYLHDVHAGTTTLLSRDLGGNAANGSSESPAINAAGTRVVFESLATTLVEGTLPVLRRIYLTELAGGTIRLVSKSSAGEGLALASETPSLSGDGRFVAFTSTAGNLVEGDSNNLSDLFLHDTLKGGTQRISVGTGAGPGTETEGNGPSGSGFFTVSSDGRAVCFRSRSTNLAGGGPTTLNRAHIYVRRLTNTDPDISAPLLSCPAEPVVAPCSSSQGSEVDYVVSAQDGGDPAPVVACDLPSGSLFPPGRTVVTCTASDASGNASSCSFEVVVLDEEHPFLRGDTNMDARLNISDSIATLAYLFTSGAPPPCEDAADSDDDGKLTITDPLASLVYLFQQGPPLPPPGTAVRGPDPTEDQLGCGVAICGESGAGEQGI